MTNSTPTHDEIAAHAYQIYLREGCVEGRDMEHWLQAETELRSRATNGNGNGHASEAPSIEPAQRSAPARAKSENMLPNSVTPTAAPIAQVSRTTTPKKSNKREAAIAK